MLLPAFLLLACESVAPVPAPPSDAEAEAVSDPAEARRLAAVQAELAQGRPTPLSFDSGSLSPAEQAMLGHLLVAAEGIEELYLRQRGAWELRSGLRDDDSRALFRRNLGPWCELAPTRDDADCSALPERPPRLSGLYPADVQVDGFCEALQAEHPDLFDPFSAIIRRDGALVAVPYSQAWPEATGRVATALDAAALALEGVAEERALQAYLRAAARAFRDDDWFAADAAWAAMSGSGSAWYLRVGPDETYGDPCGRHAGFHLGLARVSRAGLAWQQRLEPHKQELEQALAVLAGPRYAARPVGFELPEFIEVVLNAGDDRSPVGGTVGQSLPNWGPVADAGGRTVAMTNLGTDPASMQVEGQVMDSLFCPATRALWPSDPGPQLGSTVLHEAAHNLGPTGSHRVDGRSDEEVLGGVRAALLEELKAQTAALFLPPWLAERGLLPAEEVLPMAVADIGWALSQVSEGFVEGDGGESVYPELAAIQLGWLHAEGALAWRAEDLAANGMDRGCFEVDPHALGPAVDSLAARVLRIEGDMDGAGLDALVQAHVHGDPMGAWGVVTERFRRHPKPSYLYVIDGRTFEPPL